MNRLMIIAQVIVFYVIIAAIVYFISNYSIFVPPPSTYGDDTSIKKIKTVTGKTISALYMPNPNSKYIMIYSHGNAEDLGMIRQHVQQLYNLGFSMLAYDYSGYGTSEGSASEYATYEDIQAVYDYAITNLGSKPEQIILYGRSLGSGPSIYLASEVPVRAMILESPFVSAFRVVTYVPLFPIDKYNNLARINKITVPILFMHGTKDSVIPCWHGQKLYNTYQGPKQAYWVEGAGHNNIPQFAGTEYFETIKIFVSTHLND